MEILHETRLTTETTSIQSHVVRKRRPIHRPIRSVLNYRMDVLFGHFRLTGRWLDGFTAVESFAHGLLHIHMYVSVNDRLVLYSYASAVIENIQSDEQVTAYKLNSSTAYFWCIINLRYIRSLRFSKCGGITPPWRNSYSIPKVGVNQ